MKWKKIFQGSILIILGCIVWHYDKVGKENEFRNLRTRILVAETTGTVTKLANKRKSRVKLCLYSYTVDGQKQNDNYPLPRGLQGVQIGYPVKVIYLLSDPHTSRLVWTDEDYGWIE